MEMKESSWIADGAKVLGDVTIGEEVGIWYNAVIRGDCGPIRIGNRSNVQDNCTIHTDSGHDVIIGEGVTIGHNAVVHGCEISDNTLIGMGAILLNGAKIGENCIVGAGALIPEGMIVPDNSVCIGMPAKIFRETRPEELEHIRQNAEHYVGLMKEEKERTNG